MRMKAVFLILILLILALLACSPLGTPTPEPGALDTAVAETVQAELTASAPTDTPLPEATGTAPLEITNTPTEPPSPTATETLTAVPATTAAPVGTPTPTPVCPVDIAPGFAPRLEANPDILRALDCPSDAPRETWAAEQRFQLGRMFWQQDTGMIHVVYDTGIYQLVPDQFEEGDPEYACPEEGPPPAGLVMPKRGFGWNWCNTPGVRDGLGWALQEEEGYNAVWQAFENGHAFQSRLNEIFVFYDDGTWDYIE